MEFNWKNWSNGQKLIFVSSTVAVVSLTVAVGRHGTDICKWFCPARLFALSFFYLSALSSIKIKIQSSHYTVLYQAVLLSYAPYPFALSKTVEVF